MILIQDPSHGVIINLTAAEDFEEFDGSMRVRYSGSRYVLVHGLSYNMLETYNVMNTGRIKTHILEPLNFKKW